MAGIVIVLISLVTLFPIIEYFVVKSALRTKSLDDPMVKNSLIGAAAQKSKTLRIIIGTIGALVCAIFSGVIVAMLLSLIFKWNL